MVSERQIAANRKNARKSTGPRSGAGKHRASRNAFRHGLSLSISATGALAKQLEELAREIAGDTENPITLEHAWAAALAELELARAPRIKVALIERARALGDFDPPQLFSSVREAIGFSKAVARDMSITRKPINRAATLPLPSTGWIGGGHTASDPRAPKAGSLRAPRCCTTRPSDLSARENLPQRRAMSAIWRPHCRPQLRPSIRITIRDMMGIRHSSQFTASIAQCRSVVRRGRPLLSQAKPRRATSSGR
jgi:hypothetical protein